MKTALWVLMIVALVVVLAGALNHDTEVAFDYVAGSTPAVSLFWLALGVAAALVLAGIAGWAVAVASAAAPRRKLEKELDVTYRRLRDCEARLPRTTARQAGSGVTSETSSESRTATLPAPAGEAAAEVTEATAEVADDPASEATTATTDSAADEARTVVTEPPGESAQP